MKKSNCYELLTLMKVGFVDSRGKEIVKVTDTYFSGDRLVVAIEDTFDGQTYEITIKPTGQTSDHFRRGNERIPDLGLIREIRSAASENFKDGEQAKEEG